MIQFDMKKVFFDRKVVTDALDKASREALKSAGALVMTIARRSMKSGGKKRRIKSRPGEPPRTHVGLVKRMLYFAYDRGSRSVVIGPQKLNIPNDVPNVLEFGGVVIGPDRSGKPVSQKIEARPFMGPAMRQAAPSLPKRWQNTVRSS